MKAYILLALVVLAYTQVAIDYDRADWVFDFHCNFAPKEIFSGQISTPLYFVQAYPSVIDNIPKIAVATENGLNIVDLGDDVKINSHDRSKIDFMKYIPGDFGEGFLLNKNVGIYRGIYDYDLKKKKKTLLFEIDENLENAFVGLFVNLNVFGKGKKITIFGPRQFEEKIPPFVFELDYEIAQLTVINYGGEYIAISDLENIYFYRADENGSFELKKQYGIKNDGFHVKYDKFYIKDGNRFQQIHLSTSEVLKSIVFPYTSHFHLTIGNVRNLNYNTIALSTPFDIVFLNDDLEVIYRLKVSEEIDTEITYFTIVKNIIVFTSKKINSDENVYLKALSFPAIKDVTNDDFLEEYLKDYDSNMAEDKDKDEDEGFWKFLF
jgi:hypothetical protein